MTALFERCPRMAAETADIFSMDVSLVSWELTNRRSEGGSARNTNTGR